MSFRNKSNQHEPGEAKVVQVLGNRTARSDKLLCTLYLFYFVCLLFLTANLQASDTDNAQKSDTMVARPIVAGSIDAHSLMAAAIDQTRGLSSFVELKMVIHRPDWERSSQLKSWSEGRANALVRFTAPAKDAGNATLKLAEKVWTYTPKLNRVIRLPFSLMSQSWAGSDFSYNDLSRTDNLLREYELTIADTRLEDSHTIYTIRAVPKENAPVVWGKEEIVIRDDFVLLEQTFFDQDMQPYKRMETLEVGELGGRVFGTSMRMYKVEEPERWTQLDYLNAEFDLELSDNMFTLFSLKSSK